MERYILGFLMFMVLSFSEGTGFGQNRNRQYLIYQPCIETGDRVVYNDNDAAPHFLVNGFKVEFSNDCCRLIPLCNDQECNIGDLGRYHVNWYVKHLGNTADCSDPVDCAPAPLMEGEFEGEIYTEDYPCLNSVMAGCYEIKMFVSNIKDDTHEPDAANKIEIYREALPTEICTLQVCGKESICQGTNQFLRTGTNGNLDISIRNREGSKPGFPENYTIVIDDRDNDKDTIELFEFSYPKLMGLYRYCPDCWGDARGINAQIVPDSKYWVKNYSHKKAYFDGYEKKSIIVPYEVSFKAGIGATVDFGLTIMHQDASSYTQIVNGQTLIVKSWDPNYITANPPGTFIPGDTITYRIYFKNTGNAPATQIYIKNYLDPGLVHSSIENFSVKACIPSSGGGGTVNSLCWMNKRFVSSRCSSCTTCCNNNCPGGSFIVTKKNDYLLWNLDCELGPGDRGWVEYSAIIKSDLLIGSFLFNFAKIIFDTNPEISTIPVYNFSFGALHLGNRLFLHGKSKLLGRDSLQFSLFFYNPEKYPTDSIANDTIARGNLRWVDSLTISIPKLKALDWSTFRILGVSSNQTPLEWLNPPVGPYLGWGQGQPFLGKLPRLSTTTPLKGANGNEIPKSWESGYIIKEGRDSMYIYLRNIDLPPYRYGHLSFAIRSKRFFMKGGRMSAVISGGEVFGRQVTPPIILTGRQMATKHSTSRTPSLKPK